MQASVKEAIRFYLQVLGGLLAVAGLLVLAALQAGWLVPAREIPAEPPLLEEAGGMVLEVGEGVQLSSGMISVDPERVYGVSADVRTLPRPNGLHAAARFSLGVAGFDADLEPVARGNANNRFIAARRNVVNSAQGWVTYRGLASETAQDGADSLLPGTRHVRVVAEFAADDADVMVEIRDVRFYEAVTLSQ